MDYFPIFLDLRDRRCLVVGGGEMAFEKAMRLRRAGAVVGIIAPQLSPALRRAARAAVATVSRHPRQCRR